MSSIYKKGRDGYFYYQTYIFNPETGKKDKRIYHSLGTKDHNEAKSLQRGLDHKYEKTLKPNPLLNLFQRNRANLLLIIVTIFLTLKISDIFREDNLFAINKSIVGNLTEPIKDTIMEKNQQIILDTSKNKNNISGNTLSKTATIDISNTTHSNLKKNTIYQVEYKINRVETISEAFNQGKIYLTVDEKSQKDNLLKICEEIVEKYSQFSNLVICIYDDSIDGIKIANGESNSTVNKINNDVWLAMYTYNPVEGAYFDDNPN